MKITAAATVFPVADIDASIHFFTEKLGFRQEFRHGEYAGVERDNCLIHLSKQGNPNTGTPGATSVYLFCDDVEGIYQELVSCGVTVAEEPKDYDYGMRDFVAIDLDGNRITFGSPTAER